MTIFPLPSVRRRTTRWSARRGAATTRATTGASIRFRSAALPAPPSEQEKYGYFLRHRRWPFLALLAGHVGFVAAVASVLAEDRAGASAHLVASYATAGLATAALLPLVLGTLRHLRRRRTTLEEHVTRIWSWRRRRTSYPSVDVVLLAPTDDTGRARAGVVAATHIEWPGDLRLHLVGPVDPGLRQVAEAHGVTVSALPPGVAAHEDPGVVAARRHGTADLVLVLDATSSPAPEILLESVPYTADPEVDVVQTAVRLVGERSTEFGRYAAAADEVTWRWTQQSRDNDDAALAAGVSTLYRVDRLPRLDRRRRTRPVTRYVPVVLAQQSAPETWAELTRHSYARALLAIEHATGSPEAGRGQRLRRFVGAVFHHAPAAWRSLVVALVVSFTVWTAPQRVTTLSWALAGGALLLACCALPQLVPRWRATMYRGWTVAALGQWLAVLEAVDSLRSPRTRAFGTRGLDSVPRRAGRVGRAWFVVVQLVVWSGIVTFVLQGGAVARIAPFAALAVAEAVLLVPVLVRLAPVDARRSQRLRTRTTT